MSNLSDFISRGGGRLIPGIHLPGTFTPSAALLANGGQCYYELDRRRLKRAVAHSTFHASGGMLAYKTGVKVTGAKSRLARRRGGGGDEHKHCNAGRCLPSAAGNSGRKTPPHQPRNTGNDGCGGPRKGTAISQTDNQYARRRQ